MATHRITLTTVGSGISSTLNLSYWDGDSWVLHTAGISTAELQSGYEFDDNGTGATRWKVSDTGVCNQELVLECGVMPTTTQLDVTTTPEPVICLQISEQLGWHGSDPLIACGGNLLASYRGDNTSFELTTKIYGDSECGTPSTTGYYSNGTIWKYTADGINFVLDGICEETGTTEEGGTTAEPPVSFNVRLANTFIGTCSGALIPVYTSPGLTWTPGIILYADPGLHLEIIDYDYVCDAEVSGHIFYLNAGTGELGADTGEPPCEL
jgi:hypothetical protein